MIGKIVEYILIGIIAMLIAGFLIVSIFFIIFLFTTILPTLCRGILW